MIVDFTLANSTSQMESYNKQIDGFFWSWNVCHLLCYNKKGERMKSVFKAVILIKDW